MDNSRCVVVMPVHSVAEPTTQDLISELIRRGYKTRALRGSSEIGLARSMIASEALSRGFDELFWIDSDIAFDPNDVDKLRAHALPFTAGLYVKKDCSGFAGKFMSGEPITFGKGGGLLEMRWVGMGFTHIRREVFEKVKRDLRLPDCSGGYDATSKVTPYFLQTLIQEPHGWEYLSEDYSFCHRARQVGFKPMVDTTIKLGHIGKRSFTWDDLAPRLSHESFQVRFELPSQPPGTAG